MAVAPVVVVLMSLLFIVLTVHHAAAATAVSVHGEPNSKDNYAQEQVSNGVILADPDNMDFISSANEEMAAVNYLLDVAVTTTTGRIWVDPATASLTFHEFTSGHNVIVNVTYLVVPDSMKELEFDAAAWQADYSLSQAPKGTHSSFITFSDTAGSELVVSGTDVASVIEHAWFNNGFHANRDMFILFFRKLVGECPTGSCSVDFSGGDPFLDFDYYNVCPVVVLTGGTVTPDTTTGGPFSPVGNKLFLSCGTGLTLYNADAFLDSCGVCSGPGTIHVADSDRDACGVCFGGNADLDDCGVCFGGNAAKDGCGVCYGNNATCAGCDGVPYSGKVPDVCGVCGGDGSGCSGCNFIPIPLGGVWFDGCGVCGGPAGISTCTTPCIANSTAVFDCYGMCNGTAYVDDCGMCVEGTTPNEPNSFKDSCGVCFGGEAARDACGDCNGGNARRDECGICSGGNSRMDSCGVCFGGERSKDVCGVCGGNGSTCVGCDFVPNSGLLLDACGVCGGANDCQQRVVHEAASVSMLVIGGASLCFLLFVLVVTITGLAVRRRRSRRIGHIESKRTSALKSAPAGTVVVFITDVGSSTRLWEDIPEAMEEAMDVHDAIIQQVLTTHGAYIVRTEGDSFVAVFSAASASSAVIAALEIQNELTVAAWPRDVLCHPECHTQVMPGQDVGVYALRHIWRGLRVRIGLHACCPHRSFDGRSHRVAYSGAAMSHADTVASAGTPGQIVCSAETLPLLPSPMPSGAAAAPIGRVAENNGTALFDMFCLSAPDNPTAWRACPPLPALGSCALPHTKSILLTPGDSVANSISQASLSTGADTENDTCGMSGTSFVVEPDSALASVAVSRSPSPSCESRLQLHQHAMASNASSCEVSESGAPQLRTKVTSRRKKKRNRIVRESQPPSLHCIQRNFHVSISNSKSTDSLAPPRLEQLAMRQTISHSGDLPVLRTEVNDRIRESLRNAQRKDNHKARRSRRVVRTKRALTRFRSVDAMSSPNGLFNGAEADRRRRIGRNSLSVISTSARWTRLSAASAAALSSHG
ncbi:uncharacterized protein AMSG_04505 [Thecamonas trahens ATCC 50062]|uniref:Guanylate cyclase domain-containing protein n=1 Tax=Thecamonas trahens ATCC 50062 TaxID=461836 RepID=A0A0L0D7U3_THETB|nr:hypothetical protein AMSG_04505 [Thecamonas trahens ATCC 50062]KNC48275.1 hypothetical protein AMSG_04505 [Thecamonas trahens ATCC 50062]|eukprot:XP_013758842.1 hypothetical protein AMSG_04505 [Thecamonas trahens ATCC 50062]